MSPHSDHQGQSHEPFVPSLNGETPENAAALAILLDVQASGLSGLMERGAFIVRLQNQINDLAASIEEQHRAMGHAIDKAHAYLLACEKWLINRAQGTGQMRPQAEN